MEKNRPNLAVTKKYFVPILKVLLEDCDIRQPIKNGFKVTGLYPWDCSSID